MYYAVAASGTGGPAILLMMSEGDDNGWSKQRGCSWKLEVRGSRYAGNTILTKYISITHMLKNIFESNHIVV